jgi:hypothetical protein
MSTYDDISKELNDLTEQQKVILATVWCDYYPKSPCSRIQELWEYANDSNLSSELYSMQSYKMCVMDFVSKCIVAVSQEFGR